MSDTRSEKIKFLNDQDLQLPPAACLIKLSDRDEETFSNRKMRELSTINMSGNLTSTPPRIDAAFPFAVADAVTSANGGSRKRRLPALSTSEYAADILDGRKPSRAAARTDGRRPAAGKTGVSAGPGTQLRMTKKAIAGSPRRENLPGRRRTTAVALKNGRGAFLKKQGFKIIYIYLLNITIMAMISAGFMRLRRARSRPESPSSRPMTSIITSPNGGRCRMC